MPTASDLIDRHADCANDNVFADFILGYTLLLTVEHQPKAIVALVERLKPRLDRVGDRPEVVASLHHYAMALFFRARIAEQFDAVVHIDATSALTALDRWSHENADWPETYPTGV